MMQAQLLAATKSGDVVAARVALDGGANFELKNMWVRAPPRVRHRHVAHSRRGSPSAPRYCQGCTRRRAV
jgi:hypothetical protein